jgi:hypothetical protein
MGKISKIFNFDNIGGKIKNLAKWSCWITILLIWIAALIAFIVLGSEAWTAELCWIPFVGAVVGPVVIWIGSWAMYAFGEFVEDTHAIRNKYYPIEEEESKRKAEEKAKRKAEEKARREAEEQRAKCEAEKEQLSKSDIEDAASKYLKRRVSISDITCTLIYVIPKSTGVPKEMHLDMAVGNEEFTSLDLFFDENRRAYFFKGRNLALDGAWRSEEEIFEFDVSLFKEFNTEVDDDD